METNCRLVFMEAVLHARNIARISIQSRYQIIKQIQAIMVVSLGTCIMGIVKGTQDICIQVVVAITITLLAIPTLRVFPVLMTTLYPRTEKLIHGCKADHLNQVQLHHVTQSIAMVILDVYRGQELVHR